MTQQKQLLPSRRWTVLLTTEQQKTYANAIRQGYFATYDGYRWRHTFYGAFIWKYPGRIKPLNIFRDILGHPPTWKDITDDNLRDFKEALDAAYSPNSVRTICAEVNSVIRDNAESKDIPSMSYARILRAKKLVSQAVFLTDGEIQRLHLYQPRTAKRRHIKRIFMLECLCGARLSDCVRLTPDNISADGRTLTYVSQKTSHEVTVPVHPWLRQYLVPSSPAEPHAVAVSSYNEGIRFFCRALGIDTPVKIFQAGRERTGPKWQFVSSHTGRRSFATNLSLKNVPLEQIAIMMGHFTGNAPDITMTQHYIVTRLKLSAAAYQAFRIPGTERIAAEQLAANTPSPHYDDPAVAAAFSAIPADDAPSVIPERPQPRDDSDEYNTDNHNHKPFSPTASRTSGITMTKDINDAHLSAELMLDTKYSERAWHILGEAEKGGITTYAALYAALIGAQADYADELYALTGRACDSREHTELCIIDDKAHRAEDIGTPLSQWAAHYMDSQVGAGK